MSTFSFKTYLIILLIVLYRSCGYCGSPCGLTYRESPALVSEQLALKELGRNGEREGGRVDSRSGHEVLTVTKTDGGSENLRCFWC